MNSKLIAALTTAIVIAASPVAAQVTAPGAAGSNDVVPEKMAPPPAEGRSAAPGSNTLSNQLDHSNGVISPPNVDSGMRKPAPNTNTGGSVITPQELPGSQAGQPK